MDDRQIEDANRFQRRNGRELFIDALGLRLEWSAHYRLRGAARLEGYVMPKSTANTRHDHIVWLVIYEDETWEVLVRDPTLSRRDAEQSVRRMVLAAEAGVTS
jgi:hypothetical protein